jgi:hypothetical protein
VELARRMEKLNEERRETEKREREELERRRRDLEMMR